VLSRFSRLDDATQELALRQMRNPGRSPVTEKQQNKARTKGTALPFDFSNPATRKTKREGASAEKTRTLKELTSSRLSFELETTLRLGGDNLHMYLKSIGAHPLLTKQEETMLGQTIEDGVAAKAALAARDFSQSTEDELKWISQQGDSAYSTFVLSNLRLVVWTAKKYFPPEGHTLLDMIQDGNLGLIRSVEKWDWRKGHRFSTYSTWWIRQSIDRGLGAARHVRLPEHMRLQVQRLRKQASLFYSEHGRLPSQAEMAERMNISPEKYLEVAKLLQVTVSLDAPIGKGKHASKGSGDAKAFIDVIQKQTHCTPDETLMSKTLEDDLKQVVSTTLPERYAVVITKRFGLDGGGPQTLQYIGDILGVTRERVRQMETQALAKLKNGFQSKELMASLYKQLLEVEHAAGEGN
jgi:RNA polymerase sigma factor (sigma-70 family)